MTPQEITELAAQCYADPVMFCKFFLSHWFPKPMPWVHRGILAILTRKTDFLIKYGQLDKIERHFVYKINPSDPNSPVKKMFHMTRENGVVVKIDLVIERFTLIQMPRGFSKTTLVNAGNLYLICYRDCEFPLYVSETGNHAKMQLGNIKRELEINERMIEVFGNKVPARQDSEKWTAEIIETTDGIVVAARGRGGQVRGLLSHGKRPDRVVVDDLEDKESVSTPEQIRKTSVWFFSDLKPVVSKLNPDASMVIMGTLLDKDALLSVLQKDPSFTSVVFGAVDLDGEPLWEDNMNLERLEHEKASYSLAGRLSEFYMEYMSQLRDEKSAKFRTDFFRYDRAPELVAKAIAIDPAISNSRTADYCTIGVVGMGKGGKIHVCDVWGKRGASPREQIDQYFAMIQQWMPVTDFNCSYQYGVEAIAYQAALVHLIQEEMFRKKRYFEITPIKHHVKKEERILGILQPRYAAGYVTHERVFPEYEQQLLDFGMDHDDYPDVIAMAVALLDPFAANAIGEGVDLSADQYEPLDDNGPKDWKEFAHAP